MKNKHPIYFKQDEIVENANNVLQGIGIHTKWFGLKYKSMNHILKEVAKKWKGLDEDTQKKIRETLAGEKSGAELGEYLNNIT